MAITDLQPEDQVFLCPSEELVITATIDQSDPPEDVRWTIDDEPAFPRPDDPHTVLRVRGPRGETKKIVASHQQSSRSVSATWVWLVVSADPDTASISDEPRMPTITFTAIGIGGDALVSQWNVSAGTQNFSDCPPHGGAVNVNSFDTVVGGGSQITMTLDVIRGFGMIARATGSVRGCPLTASGSCGLDGTNPRRSDIQSALPHDALRRIACRESGQRQFNAPPDGGIGFCPLFGRRRKAGIMQIPDPTADEAWNWRLNVAKGIEIFNDKVETARAYPNQVRESSEFKALVAGFNQRRQQQELPPLQIRIPDFTAGNFDDDLQQLELDAIRGYNGWHGADRFGFELHEFRVAVDEVDADELLRVINVDEQTLEGAAVWERVPVMDRPIGRESDPNYVDSVLSFLGSCNDSTSPAHSCTVVIRTGGSALSFSPPSLTGEETFEAELIGTLPGNRTVAWKPVELDGFTGTVVADSADALTVRFTARHPNKARLRVQVEVDSDVICFDQVDISVPQFFHLQFLPTFDNDLEMLGLKRKPPAGSALTPGQIETNETVKQRIIEEILRTLIRNFEGINVRFTLLDPGSIVGQANVSTIVIGGGNMALTEDPAGVAPVDKDNCDAGDTILVFSGEYTDRSHDFASGLYVDIFDELAIEEQNGNALPGTPVDGGEFPLGPAVDQVRKNYIAAAIMAFGRFIGTVASHECGHALGLGDNNAATPNLMRRSIGSFTDHTGITSFNIVTGDFSFHDPVRFRTNDAMVLFGILPVIAQ